MIPMSRFTRNIPIQCSVSISYIHSFIKIYRFIYRQDITGMAYDSLPP